MPRTLGRYSLEKSLAVGGMAEVFLARQAGPGGYERLCVVKCMLEHLSEDPVFVQMFLDEARLAAQLNHPNIAQIYDFGIGEGKYFIAMEYAPGCDLGTLIKSQRAKKTFLPYPAVARIISLCASALEYAHRATDQNGARLNLIHRDVSPQNILLTRTGAAKLIDFGIAKAASACVKTKTGMIKGKYLYMSPEQVRGEELDLRSDIFSLGMVLYQAMANEHAVQADGEVDVLRTLVSGKWDRIDRYRTDVPQELEAVLEKALQKERDQRFNTAGEMAIALERWLTHSGNTLTDDDLAALVTSALGPGQTGKTSPGPTAGEAPLPDLSALEPLDMRPTKDLTPPRPTGDFGYAPTVKRAEQPERPPPPPASAVAPPRLRRTPARVALAIGLGALILVAAGLGRRFLSQAPAPAQPTESAVTGPIAPSTRTEAPPPGSPPVSPIPPTPVPVAVKPAPVPANPPSHKGMKPKREGHRTPKAPALEPAGVPPTPEDDLKDVPY